MPRISDAQGNELKLNTDGSMKATITGSLAKVILAEQKTNADADANVITFAEVIEAIEIYHEETTWQTFIVNGLTIQIPSGGWARPVGGVASAEVTIPAIACLVGRLI